MAAGNDAPDGMGPIDAKLGKLAGGLQRAQVEPLGHEIGRIVTEDNRRGILAGTDKDDHRLAPVKYRKGVGWVRKARRGALLGTSDPHDFQGFGPLSGGWNGNLRPAQYRKLTGPPLAPRRHQSRVITNFRTRFYFADGQLVVEAAWLDVVSIKGIPFLSAHFTGRNRLPARDLRGVRPAGRRLVREAVRAWVRWLMGGGTT